MNFLPVHFSVTEVPEAHKSDIRLWIQNRLHGRYFLGTRPIVSSKNKLVTPTVVGFEDKKELTYFMLACPFQRRK